MSDIMAPLWWGPRALGFPGNGTLLKRFRPERVRNVFGAFPAFRGLRLPRVLVWRCLARRQGGALEDGKREGHGPERHI